MRPAGRGSRERSDVPPKPKPFTERFWGKVGLPDDVTGCMPWLAHTNHGGYGHFMEEKRPRRAHRVAYEVTHGSVPAGLVVDHLCGNRSCVRPDHLEAVTQRVNLLRGATRTAAQVARTTCPQGHSYSRRNTYAYRGKRMCRICRRVRNRDAASRRREGNVA